MLLKSYDQQPSAHLQLRRRRDSLMRQAGALFRQSALQNARCL